MKYLLYILVAAASFILGVGLSKYLIPMENTTVTKVQERVRVVTKIVERPDGSKETVIVKEKDTESGTTSVRVFTEPKWSVSAATSILAPFLARPVYTVQVDRRLLLGAFVGVYGRTDGEFGLSFRYEF